MIVVMSCIDSTVVIVVWCRGPAMAMSAVNGEGASPGGSAGARPEPEQQEHKQRDTTGSREEGKQRKQPEEKRRHKLGAVADSGTRVVNERVRDVRCVVMFLASGTL